MSTISHGTTANTRQYLKDLVDMKTLAFDQIVLLYSLKLKNPIKFLFLLFWFIIKPMTAVNKR